MKERIKDKIKLLEKYLEELEERIPSSFEEYEEDLDKKAICERYFEKIIAAVLDISFLVIRIKDFPSPREDSGVFEILFEKKVISKELCEKLMEAKSMRNIIAHEYGEIDDEQVFNSVKYELIEDINNFLEVIEKSL